MHSSVRDKAGSGRLTFASKKATACTQLAAEARSYRRRTGLGVLTVLAPGSPLHGRGD